MSSEQRYFSIVMPLYNKEKYIRDSVQSVLNQTYKHFELIIVDDGSTDNSAKILQQFDDERVRYIIQENQGETATRNNAMALSKYDYIAFLDSDDFWLSDFLETMNALINEYPNAGAYGCAYLHVPASEKVLQEAEQMDKKRATVLTDNYFDYDHNHSQTLTASTTVIKKKILEKVGMFTPGLRNWGDIDFWTRIGLYYDVAFTEKVCTIYNDVATGASKLVANLHAPVFDNYKKYMRDKTIPKQKRKDFKEYVIRHKLYSIYQQFLIDNKRFKAFKKLLGCGRTKKYKKMYISMMLQFILSPKVFFKLNSLRKRK